MKNGIYDCVIVSLLGVGLRIAIWCETPWGRGTTQPVVCLVEHTPHCICLPFWSQRSLHCTMSQPVEESKHPPTTWNPMD